MFLGGTIKKKKSDNQLNYRHHNVLWINQMYKIQSIEMDKPNTFKQLGSGLIPTLVEESHIKNGFNHLSLQHNLPHRNRIVLWVN